jgi:probable HAF family extracellular repeat protein
MTDLGTLGGSTSVAFGVNPQGQVAAGQVAGESETANGEMHATLWRRTRTQP